MSYHNTQKIPLSLYRWGYTPVRCPARYDDRSLRGILWKPLSSQSMTLPPLPGPDHPEEDLGQRSLALFDNAPVGLWEVNVTGIIISVNHTLLDWLGYARAEVVNRRKLETLVSPESAATLQELAERCRRVGQATGITLMWRGGHERQTWPGEVTATAVYDAQGQWLGWRGSVQMASQVTGERDRLLQERTLEAVERLASGVAHKFNNLLQVIQGYAELGLITLESSHPVHSNLARIKEAAQRAAILVQGLVVFSRRQTVRRRPLELKLFTTQCDTLGPTCTDPRGCLKPRAGGHPSCDECLRSHASRWDRDARNTPGTRYNRGKTHRSADGIVCLHQRQRYRRGHRARDSGSDL